MIAHFFKIQSGTTYLWVTTQCENSYHTPQIPQSASKVLHKFLVKKVFVINFEDISNNFQITFQGDTGNFEQFLKFPAGKWFESYLQNSLQITFEQEALLKHFMGSVVCTQI